VVACSKTSTETPAVPNDPTEQDKFQGTWRAQKLTSGGVEASETQRKSISFTFKDDVVTPERDPNDSARIKLDAGKNPAQIDIVDKNGIVDHGIYRFLDGDTLELCLAEKPNRPTEFASPKDSKVALILLKRIKK
jgi:uncharacterized protein (TIGR03067 family)